MWVTFDLHESQWCNIVCRNINNCKKNVMHSICIAQCGFLYTPKLYPYPKSDYFNRINLWHSNSTPAIEGLPLHHKEWDLLNWINFKPVLVDSILKTQSGTRFGSMDLKLKQLPNTLIAKDCPICIRDNIFFIMTPAILLYIWIIDHMIKYVSTQITRLLIWT